MKQKSFAFMKDCPKAHGGELALGKRKTRRPLSRTNPIHLTLKAKRVLLTQKEFCLAELQRLAIRFGLRVYDIAVGHDHIHFLTKIPDRHAYNAFIRAFTGILARKLGKKLWQLLPFSRIGHWGKGFHILKNYLQKNRDEAEGKRAYEPRKDYYRKFRPKPAPSS